MMDKTFDTSLSRKTLKIYWQATKRYPRNLVVAVVARPIYLLCAYIGNVYITGVALDKLRSGGNFGLWQDFGGIIVGLIALMVGQVIFEYLSVRNIWTLEAKVMRDLSDKAY